MRPPSCTNTWPTGSNSTATCPLIPAVTHADGTGRLPTVTEADNGVPMVLNTRQALDCFLRNRMDVLVLADVLVRRGSGFIS